MVFPYDGKLSSISSQDIASVTVPGCRCSLYGSSLRQTVLSCDYNEQGQNGSAPTIQLSANMVSRRAVRDYDQLSTNDYFMLCNSFATAILTTDQDPVEAAQKLSYRCYYTQTGGLVLILTEQLSAACRNRRKNLAGATPLWDDSWEDALTHKTLTIQT